MKIFVSIAFASACALYSHVAMAQQDIDTVKVQQVDEVVVKAVRASMEIGSWEEGNHFFKDIVQEIEHQFLTRTHNNVFNTPHGTQSPLFPLA